MSKIFKRLTSTLIIMSVLLGHTQVMAFYKEIYKQRLEDYWKKKPSIENIDKDRGLMKDELESDVKDYIFVCPDTKYEKKDLEDFWEDRLPEKHQNGEIPLSFSSLARIKQAAFDCMTPQVDLYQTKKALEHFSALNQEKVNEQVDDHTVEDIDPQGDDYDLFRAMRENVIKVHGEDEAQKIKDYTYFEESKEAKEKSPEPPKGLYPEGRPLQQDDEAKKSTEKETPGQDKGQGGLMKALTETITLLQEVNKTPKKAQQTALLVFESGLAGEGKDFGEHYSKPFFFLEWVPDVAHYSLFDEQQYDSDIWKEVEGFLSRIIDEEPCAELTSARTAGKNITDAALNELDQKCAEFRKAAYKEELHRQEQASRMKRLFMDAEYRGKQLVRDVENYEQLAYLVKLWKDTTETMAAKPSIAGESNLLENLMMKLFNATAQAQQTSTNDEDHYKCEESDFKIMKQLVQKARKDANEIKSLSRSSSSSSGSGDKIHTVTYNKIIHDDYQLYLQYLKWTLFPESMRKLFDEYYKEVGQMDEDYFNIEDKEKQKEAGEIIGFHYRTIDTLLPYVIMPERITTGSSAQDVEEFAASLEKDLGDSIAALQREFDWGRMRYCADKDIFDEVGVKDPKDLQEKLLERPDTFNAYVNAGVTDITSRKEIRDKRRAPSMGTFNPETFCSAQSRKEDQENENKETDNYFDALRDFIGKIFNFFDADNKKKGKEDERFINNFEAAMNDEVKELSRTRKRDHVSMMNCMTQYYKKLHEFDQFNLEMEEERFNHALVPIIEDSNDILDGMKEICQKHHVTLGCPVK